MARESLNQFGIETLRLFEKIKEHSTSDPEYNGAPFAAEADRFELWATNLGLFVSGHGSLDYRLRQAESLGGTFQKLMSGLNDSLVEGWSLHRLSDYAHALLYSSGLLGQ